MATPRDAGLLAGRGRGRHDLRTASALQPSRLVEARARAITVAERGATDRAVVLGWVVVVVLVVAVVSVEAVAVAVVVVWVGAVVWCATTPLQRVRGWRR